MPRENMQMLHRKARAEIGTLNYESLVCAGTTYQRGQ